MSIIGSLSLKHFLHPVYLLLVLFFVMQLTPEGWQNLLAYSRTEVMQGEWWRLITAHIVHLSWTHLIMNSLALLAFFLLYGESKKAGFLLMIILSLSISFCLLLFNPSVQRYVGFSGVLTGLLLASAALTFNQDKLVNSGVIGFVLAKITYEQWQSQEIVASSFSGVPTVVDSHLYGAVAAIIYCCLIAAFGRSYSKRA